MAEGVGKTEWLPRGWLFCRYSISKSATIVLGVMG